MIEIWKDIEGYEGLYQVSNLGQVKSLDGKRWNGHRIHNFKGKVLRQSVSGKMQYRSVVLSQRGKTRTQRVHTLVAKAFLEPCPGVYGKKKGQYCVNHIDSDTSNNRADNLEWATHKQNMNHSYNTNDQSPLRNFRNLTVNGVTKTFTQWSKGLGGNPGLISYRLSRGWTVEEATSLPVGSRLKPVQRDANGRFT